MRHDQPPQSLDRFRCRRAEQLVDLAAQRLFLGGIEQPCHGCRVAPRPSRLATDTGSRRLANPALVERMEDAGPATAWRAPTKPQDNHEFQTDAQLR